MMRSNPSSSMQKVYDDCYLICSTAIYFEKQNNEEEALRSWRDALDQIYYHNAYKIPASYRPRTETEKALQESLRDMELQCKERVDLLNALRQSRNESQPGEFATAIGRPLSQNGPVNLNLPRNDNTVQRNLPTASFSDLTRPKAHNRANPSQNFGALHGGPSERPNTINLPRSSISAKSTPMPAAAPFNYQQAILSVPTLPERKSRSPSPKKEPSLLKSTLRPRPKESARTSSSKMVPTLRNRGSHSSTSSSASAAASLAWPGTNQSAPHNTVNGSSTNFANGADGSGMAHVESLEARSRMSPYSSQIQSTEEAPPNLIDLSPDPDGSFDLPIRPNSLESRQYVSHGRSELLGNNCGPVGIKTRQRTPPLYIAPITSSSGITKDDEPRAKVPTPEFPSYRKEYPPTTLTDSRKVKSISAVPNSPLDQHSLDVASPSSKMQDSKNHKPRAPVSRKAVPSSSLVRSGQKLHKGHSSNVGDNQGLKGHGEPAALEQMLMELPNEDPDSDKSHLSAWDARIANLMENLPRGVDEQAAKAIFNEIVIKGDEVHWDDVAGLDVAKNALKEAVVYPFLRPDLFLGLREPARGMLLFGPPGTGKTMLARAVATESKSTFFAISASSLTSKFLGESEKLVRALFVLAKALAPSIIFVDEIDSLLSSRSGTGEHEATRRIKTEFLIQWSDLAKAAAGREQSDKDKAVGDATRVLVLAATNLPWAIDEAARRRFVRRQYIPLPEPPVREDQLRRLMSAQKHALQDNDVSRLVKLTEGFSGSDITALAKDAAMGPLRSLGEQLLHMTPDEIRPIAMQDFEASLATIRPSVSKQGLKEFENWAREFGERGG